MARRTTPTPPPPPAKLLMTHNAARDRLISRREAGQTLLATLRTSVTSEPALEEAQAPYRKWRDFNSEMLRRMFDQPEYAEDFDRAGNPSVLFLGGGRSYWNEDAKELFDKIQLKVDYLENLAERIELIPLAHGVTDTAPPAAARRIASKGSTKVFIVHGRDEEAKAVVARFLDRCGLVPVILHEQTDQGRTVIEKFEQESDVNFAVVLLTPDDVGALLAASLDISAMQPRARQNVILELGYFVGKLGRDRVCAFKKGDLEVPSDFSGVLYTPFGADESWKVRLARELKAAGYAIDLNVALG